MLKSAWALKHVLEQRTIYDLLGGSRTPEGDFLSYSFFCKGSFSHHHQSQVNGLLVRKIQFFPNPEHILNDSSVKNKRRINQCQKRDLGTNQNSALAAQYPLSLDEDVIKNRSSTLWAKLNTAPLSRWIKSTPHYIVWRYRGSNISHFWMGALEQNLQKAYVTQPVLKNSDPRER